MKKTIIMLLFISIFLIGIVSAFEFDNVKTYDIATKEVTFKNAFGLPEILGGGEIAKAKLISEQNVELALENQTEYRKVAEFEINSYSDYANAINSIELFDLKNGNQAVERKIDYKYKVIEYFENDTIELICKEIIEGKNGTQQVCNYEIVGKHLEENVSWKDLSSMDLKVENLTIGLFTDVKVGDRIEWIPNLFGVRVVEWATFSAYMLLGESLAVLSDVSQTTPTLKKTIMMGVYGANVTYSNNTLCGSSNFQFAIRSYHKYYYEDSTTGNSSESYWNTNNVCKNFVYTNPNQAKLVTKVEVYVWQDSWNPSYPCSEKWDRVYGYNVTKANAPPTITLNSPINAYNSTSQAITFNCTASDDSHVQNVTFYLNNSLNETNTSGINNTDYLFSKTLAEGFYSWNCGTCDNETACTNATARNLTINTAPQINVFSPISNNSNYTTQIIYVNATSSLAVDDWKLDYNGTNYTITINSTFTFLDGNYRLLLYGRNSVSGIYGLNDSVYFNIDSTPFIEFVEPTPENNSNLSVPYIPVNVSLTETYFKNVTFNFYKGGVLNESVTFTDGTRFYNKTGCTCDNWEINVTTCTTTNKCNSTETRKLTIDILSPDIELFSPLTNFTTLSLPINVTLNFTATDTHLSTCWYEYNATNTTFTCNTLTNISVNTSGAHSFSYYANDSLGNEAGGQGEFYVYYVQPTATATSPITEGGTSSHVLFVNMTDVKFYSPTAYLIWNGTNKGAGTLTNVSNDVARFDKSFIVPNINGTSVNWTWVYNLSTTPSVENWNLSGSQTFISINLTECGAGTYVILNYTMYDQETKAIASTDNASIEVDLILTSQADDSLTWQFHTTKANSTNLSICLPSGALNSSSYNLDSIAKYSYQAHVVQYNYIVNFNLNSTTIPQTISLYDLATADSTSFLINYQDENYLYVEDAIIDVWRRYIGDGVFISVEHGKTDASGQTRLHLVTEDIIYKFLVWQDGELVYTSPEYLALCQATPCQINLRKTTEDTNGLSERDNVVYSYVFNDTTRTASFTFATLDNTETEMNMTIYLSNQYLNDTACSTLLTTSGGQIDCIIPPAYANTTYQAIILKDGEYFGTAFNSLAPKSMEIFGYTGIILTAIGYLMLALMGISSGIATIVLGITGLAIMGILQIFESGSIFGLTSAIIWLIVAGVIIIIKISKRRIQ